MKEDGILRVGIIGTGWIAEKADGVLCNLHSWNRVKCPTPKPFT